MAPIIGRLSTFGGLLLVLAAQQAIATEITLRGADGRTSPIAEAEVVAPDGTVKSGRGNGKSVVNLSGTPATSEQIVLVRDPRGYVGATTIRGAPDTVAIDTATMISPANTSDSNFAADQVAATEAAIKVCDRVAYDAAVARLENFRLAYLAAMQKKDAELVAASRDLGIAPQHTMDGWGKLVRDADRAATAGFGDRQKVERLKKNVGYGLMVSAYENYAYHFNQAESQRANIKPFPNPCDKQVGYLGIDGKSSFGVTFNVGMSNIDLPNYRAYSIEDMGNFINTGVLKDDRKVTALRLEGSGFIYIPGTETALRFGGSYLDASNKTKFHTKIVPLAGQRFDIPTPEGGFYTTSDVGRFRFMQEFSEYQLYVRAEQNYRFNGVRLRPRFGVNFNYIDSQDASRFKIAGHFARFEEWREIDTYGGGPAAGVEVEVPIERGMYGFGGIDGELRWNYSSAKWKTQLDVMGNPSDKQSIKKSDSQLSWGLGGTVGVGYRGQSVDVRLFGSIGVSNHYPYLDVKSDVGDGDPGIKWDTSMQYRVGVEAKFGL